MFHEDKGTSTVISQIANACASVICGKDLRLSDCTMKDARVLFQELCRTQRARADTRGQEFNSTYSYKASFTKTSSDRATSPKMVSQAEGLVATFEIVPHAQATSQGSESYNCGMWLPDGETWVTKSKQFQECQGHSNREGWATDTSQQRVLRMSRQSDIE